MGKDDFILEAIFAILESDTDMSEDGYFRSIREKAYRCEATRQMFCGLRRESQDKVLQLAMELLIEQNGLGIEVRNGMVKGGQHNGKEDGAQGEPCNGDIK